MFSLGKHFIFTVLLTMTLTTKAKLEMFPFCENDTTTRNYNKPALKCYNYKGLPTDLQNPKVVKKLSMKSQYLERLKIGEFSATNLIKLKSLYLRDNAIKTIEMGAFLGAQLLRGLWLERNEIEELDLRVFKDLPNLRWLSMDGNPLKGFSSDVKFPRLNLTLLNLSDCKITSIPPNLFKNLGKLYSLTLNNNQLEVFDWKSLLPLKSLGIIFLKGNPFHCDCQVKFVLDFLDMKYLKRLDDIPASCQSSPTSSNKQLIGVDWNEIDRKLLICPSKINSIYLSKPNHNQTINGDKMGIISVECEYEGYPEPNVTWIRDGRLVSFENGVTIKSQRDDDTLPAFNYKFKQTLIIPNSPVFHGNYKCQAAPDRVATLKVGASNIPRYDSTTPTMFKNMCTTEGTAPFNKDVYKSSILEPSSTVVNIFSTTTFESVTKTSDNDDKGKDLGENPSLEFIPSLQIIIVALGVVVLLLLGVIISSGIYIAVRYTKTKRKALPKKIYKTVPIASRQNRVSQTVASKDDPPYPPLMENVYEICGDGEVNFYEIPVIPPITLHFNNQTYLGQDFVRPNKSSNQTC